MSGMDIGWAIRVAKEGGRARRHGWAAPRDWWIELRDLSLDSAMDWPYLMKAWPGGAVPWEPTHVELLAEDWEMRE